MGSSPSCITLPARWLAPCRDFAPGTAPATDLPPAPATDLAPVRWLRTVAVSPEGPGTGRSERC